MRRRRGHGHQYNTLVIPNVMKYTIVQDGRTNTILLFTIKVNRQNSGQKTKGRTTICKQLHRTLKIEQEHDLKPGVNSGRVSRSCSTSGTRRDM